MKRQYQQYQRRTSLVKAQVAPRLSDDPALRLELAGAAALVALSFVPGPLLLPLVGIVSMAGAALTALLAWRLGVQRDSEQLTLWDLSGACALIGIAAGIFSDSERTVEAVLSVAG